VIQVILLFRDGMRDKVILSSVPRRDERIRLAGGKTLIVEDVLWLEEENGNEPAVLISVREADKVPG
jgi:hypothetical protein